MPCGDKWASTFPTQFAEVIRIADQCHPWKSAYKIFQIIKIVEIDIFYKLVAFKVSWKFVEHKLYYVPFLAGAPPTIRVCVTLEKPHPSSGVNKRPFMPFNGDLVTGNGFGDGVTSRPLSPVGQQIWYKLDGKYTLYVLHLLTQEALDDVHLHLAVCIGKLHSIFECIECMPDPFVWPQIRLKLLDIHVCWYIRPEDRWDLGIGWRWKVIERLL